MSINPVVGRRMAAYRRTRKMTKTAIAAALGLSGVRELNRIEEGRQKVTAPQVMKAMELFDATMDDMTDPFRLDPGEARWTFRTGPHGDEMPLGEDA